ncbi:MAG: hypothetical protein K2H85_05985 [Allobaculum sp.]|nr:hypothetical protein [Allobaculum sp.]
MKFYGAYHTPSTSSPQVEGALATISEALTTTEQKEALAYLERELNLALAYITELEWEAEEASALIKQLSDAPDWNYSTDYLEAWAKDCCKRLDAHRLKNLSSLVRGEFYGYPKNRS